MRALAGLSLLFLGCGTAGGGGAVDMAPPADLARAADLALPSLCGHPGDKGNSLGVGKFCRTFDDCANQAATLCSAIGNGATSSPDDTYFCTIYPCQLDAGTSQCAEGATCACKSGQCACTPNSCLGA